MFLRFEDVLENFVNPDMVCYVRVTDDDYHNIQEADFNTGIS
jgi:hypothetical protein